MVTRNAAFYTAGDGTRLYYQTCVPDADPTGAVIILQGMGGGGQRDFQAFADAMGDSGHATFLVHQRGTGLSEGARGDVSDFQVIVRDYAGILTYLHDAHPHLPLFLLGHSQGGAIAVALAAQQLPLAGVVLLNPACRLMTSMRLPLGEMLRYSLYYMFRPSVPVVNTSPDPQTIAFPPDRAEVEAKRSDPWVVSRLSLRFLMGSKRLMDSAAANAAHARTPLLLLYGDQDRFIDHRGSEAVLAAWGAADKRQVILQGCGHGAHVADAAAAHVLSWLERARGKADPAR